MEFKTFIPVIACVFALLNFAQTENSTATDTPTGTGSTKLTPTSTPDPVELGMFILFWTPLEFW